jgi:hypothetical protein
MDIVVVFTQEYSKVLISTGNEKCKEPELIHPGDMMTKGKEVREISGREGIS